MDTFTFCPFRVIPGKVTLRTLSASMGDGYIQEAADGINTRSDSWDLTFRGKESKITPIRAFIDAQLGYKSFLWTPPSGTQKKYRASEYTLTETDGRIWELNITFNQRY